MDHIETDSPVTLETVRRIGAAFAARDVEGIVNAFAPDGEFRNAHSLLSVAEMVSFFHAWAPQAA